MFESSIGSVAYVCRAEAARLRELVRELEQAEPSRLEPTLKALSKTGDTLSAGLARVATWAEHLEHETDNSAPGIAPNSEPVLLEVVRRLRLAEKFGFCDACGGVLNDDGDHGRIADAAEKSP